MCFSAENIQSISTPFLLAFQQTACRKYHGHGHHGHQAAPDRNKKKSTIPQHHVIPFAYRDRDRTNCLHASHMLIRNVSGTVNVT